MTLSTHVLDTARGEPAAGVPVRLERAGVPLASGVTGADGRLRFDNELLPGRYRLVFDTAGAFFPEVVVVFEVTDPVRHLHVPLLLSPYGYTTYRGS
jgi:5-hydroxyisourate hydrolase